MKINLPTKKGDPNTSPEVEFNHLVVIGANGSGKTRFGSWIEEMYAGSTHRISAQKSLQMPLVSVPSTMDRAEKEFFYGGYSENWKEHSYVSQKVINRWGRNINTHLLNDFSKLMNLLHTEEYEQSLLYKEGKIEKPVTKLDTVQRIWEHVLPHRKLIKRAGKIETYPTDDESKVYESSEMSDGERVIFYLIGEVICTPKESIIIIDEPEMHIHKALVKELFDLIEQERTDCSFIYLTHDIDFAFSRQNATKIWTKNFEDNVWDYEILDKEMPIPEQLYLEVLGSRKPILFIEGDNSSIDYEIYEQVYSEFTLKPLGSCEKVIHVVKSFDSNKDFHHIDSFGLIDRDRRTDTDVSNLIQKGIWVLDVAEAENLLLIEEVIRATSRYLGKNEDEVFGQVQHNVVEFFKSQLDNQILIHFRDLMRRELISLSDFEAKKIEAVENEIDTNFGKIDKQKLFAEIRDLFQKLIAENDYNGILKVFNLKNAIIPESKICQLLGISSKPEFKNLVVTILKMKNEHSELIAEGIKARVII
ncbi:MAG: AAA family ATPase [Allomuricauda sp.]